MRSGRTVCSALCRVSRPWIRRRRAADAFDPRAHLDQAIGKIDDLGFARGFSIRLSPRASTAAIKALCVAPTETLDRLPCCRSARAAPWR